MELKITNLTKCYLEKWGTEAGLHVLLLSAVH